MSTEFPGSECVGRVVEGKFRLLHWLGGTEHSSAYMTLIAGSPPRSATMKFIAAAGEDNEARNRQWSAAKSLSHPNLLRLYEFGGCKIDGNELLYTVSEYADEVLSEVLAERALNEAEVREMIPPLLDALSYLHNRGLVHGALSPSNILAVGNRLKLSVDEVEAAGETHSRSRWPGGYDAPEVVDGKISPATDVWAMGVVLVKALSQEMPSWNRWSGGEPAVPESLPEPFAGIARECLQVDPSQRCTLATIKARLEPGAAVRRAAAPIAAAAPVPAATPPPAPTPAAAPIAAAAAVAPAPAAAPATPPKRVPAQAAASGGEAARESRAKVPAAIADLTRATDALYRDPAFRGARKKAGIFAWAILLVAVIVFAVLEIHSHHSQAPTEAVTQNSVPAPAAPQAVQPAPEKPVQNGSAGNGAVVQQVMPEVSPTALATIQGHVRVAIHVEVDADGNVSNAAIETEGPSRYFANQALNAARGWKFRPAEKDGQAIASTWTLHFVFASSGVVARPAETRP